MIIEKFNQEGTLVTHYSDRSVFIEQVETGNRYSEAVDIVPCRYTYEETDDPIPTDEATIEDYSQQIERFGVKA